jgi:hypothetical protein
MGWGAIETLDLIFKKLPEHTFLTGRYIKNSPSIRKIFTIESFCALLCLSSPVVASFFDPGFEWWEGRYTPVLDTINRRKYGRFGRFKKISKGFRIAYIPLDPGVFADPNGVA